MVSGNSKNNWLAPKTKNYKCGCDGAGRSTESEKIDKAF